MTAHCRPCADRSAQLLTRIHRDESNSVQSPAGLHALLTVKLIHGLFHHFMPVLKRHMYKAFNAQPPKSVHRLTARMHFIDSGASHSQHSAALSPPPAPTLPSRFTRIKMEIAYVVRSATWWSTYSVVESFDRRRRLLLGSEHPYHRRLWDSLSICIYGLCRAQRTPQAAA